MDLPVKEKEKIKRCYLHNPNLLQVLKSKKYIFDAPLFISFIKMYLWAC